MPNLEEKKQHYIEEINRIEDSSFNKEQKKLACDILGKADEANIDSIYTFITQRVKTGFVFDVAPEIAHNCISLCERDDTKGFGSPMDNAAHHKLIIGENYDALKNLVVTYTEKGKGLIDVIYIDPPYNTEKTKDDGNDYKDDVESKKFIYRDKFSRTGWLNMMRERLVLARKLLKDNGVIFISIDNAEQAYLKVLCDEIFGEDNFIGNIVWLKGNAQNDADNLQGNHEYILIFAKHNNKDLLSTDSIRSVNVMEDNGRYFYEGAGITTGGAGGTLNNRPKLGYTIYFNPITKDKIAIMDYDVEMAKYSNDENELYEDNVDLLNKGYVKIRAPRKGNRLGRWAWSVDKFNKEKNDIFIKQTTNGYSVVKKVFVDNTDEEIIVAGPLKSFIEISSSNGTKILNKIFNTKIFDNPKPVNLISYLIKSYYNKSSIILDFFAGSGTTAQAVMELNAEDGGQRQCILVTNNENNIATDVTYERLYRIINGKGTNEETFEWKYTEEKPYLTDNYVDVFNVKSYKLNIDDYDKSEELISKAKAEFKKLNPDYEEKDFDIYKQLASLKPYVEKKSNNVIDQPAK